ncbi:RagB/SusD family nutrient uptake outer membrane protein [Lutibacter citreus]|uniref:RagB/SusD family nutrient uptake outer membrane protein n=1 Tax=Lutibacter citreus TaxID=2138210 RepID=UPI000DBE540B|nr:RagB/SusD family nutrient uptake outer membrane protein [Lutibacter citreus]
MKHIIFKYILLIFAVSFLSSCGDEYLDEKNPNEIAKDNYWRNLSETEKGLNSAYHTLNVPALVSIIEEAQRSDMAWPAYARPVPGTISEFYNQTYSNSTPAIASKWETNYLGIFRANQVIEGLNTIKGTVDDVEWTSQMAQARFLRGLFHWYLYSTFNNGSIIIRDYAPVTNEDFNKGLSPASEVLAFLREDLEYAYANLYAKGEYPNAYDVNRVTSGAAATVLGTTYLMELNYSKAMEYFTDVLNSGDYALEYDMAKLFTTAGEFNQESILEISYNNTLKPEANLWNGETVTNRLNQLTTGTVGANAPTWLAYKYKTEPMDILDDRNYYVNEDGVRLLRNVPLRCSAMMAVIEDGQTPYYLTKSVSEYSKFGANNWGIGWHKKFSNHDIVENENDLPYGTTQSGKNVTLNRLAEVMLMQAECLIKTGDGEGAMLLMNEIRKRWGLELIGESGSDVSHSYDENTYSLDELMEHLMYVEKPLEMSLEGHAIRFLDLKRWGIIKENFKKLSEQTYYATTYFYTNSEGKAASKWNSSVVKELPTTGVPQVIDFEYDIPYSNYNEALHSTFPIPLTEINANTNIN